MNNSLPPTHKSIRNKIVVGLLLVVFSIMLPIEIFEYFQLKQQMQTELEDLSAQKIQRLAENLQLPLWELDKTWVEKVILAEMTVDYVYAISVDSEGDWFAGKVKDAQWRTIDTEKAPSGDFIQKEKEITRKGKRIGMVRLFVTSQFFKEKLLLSIAVELLKSLILSALLIVSLRVLLNRLVIDPLQNMLAVVNDIANGNYKRNIGQTIQNDEIGILASAMQRMTESLRQASQAAIAVAEGDYTHKLEARGKEDLFAQAMNRMIDSLDEVVKQIDIISLGNYQTHIVPRSEHDTLGIATERMSRALETFNSQHQQQIRLQQSILAVADVLRAEDNIETLASRLIQTLCKILNAYVGILFLLKQENGETFLYQAGRYAYSSDQHPDDRRYPLGEGLVGQVALEQRFLVIQPSHEDRPRIQSGLIDCSPHTVILSPFSFKNEIRGVIELGFPQPIGEIEQELLTQTQEAIASAFESIYIKNSLSAALKQSQIFSEELQASNEALLAKTDQLEKQTLELRESERINLERAKELEESNRYKSEFLANMSHELRTPLNSLLILAKLLADNEQGNLNEEQVESARVIQSSGKHLLQLINDILDLSKAEAGRMTAAPSKVHFSNLLQLLHQRFQPLVREKHLQFHTEAANNLPEFFVSDRQKLEHILTNLLGNAVKFTHHGSISLTLTPVRENSEDWICFAVSDTGVGIPSDQLEKIFSSFHQVDGSFNRCYAGTGLGLSIALTYAVLLGGRIDVQSRLSEGSTFSLLLPLHWGGAPQTVQPPPDASPPISKTSGHREKTDIAKPQSGIPKQGNRLEKDTELAKKSVMIVDDDMRNSYALAKALRTIGMEVTIADSGRDALIQLGENQAPDIILLDMMMPEMDGFETIKRIRKLNKFDDVPIVAVSAKDMPRDREEYLTRGANDYLAKPIDMDRLIALLQSWLSNSSEKRKPVPLP